MSMENIDASPLGWEIDLLYLFAHCATILADDVDAQLKRRNPLNFFNKEKKKALNDYFDCIKKIKYWFNRADEYMEQFNLEGSTFDATNKSSKAYSNVIASANELIRASMLVIDRGNCDGGQARVFKRLRSLPEQGIFPEKFIERFQMKYEIVPESGDRIINPNHGEGTLMFHTGKNNWCVKLDNGKEIILNEKTFRLL